MLKFRKTKPQPTADQIAEIERLEAEVIRHRRQREESFQRCDTDGFLSQWASGISANLEARKIELLRDGGHAQFRVLVDADGNVVATKIYRFQNQFNFGTDERWKLPAELEAKAGRRWIPTGEKSRVQKQLGLREERRWFPAYAAIGGSGKGLSGCATAFVGVWQQGDEDRSA